MKTKEVCKQHVRIASLHPQQWLPHDGMHIKPHLRGWLHLVTAPLALSASIVLICLAPTPGSKVGCAVFLATSLILFGISALYHRFYWSPRWEGIWRRLDHSNIFLLIAGTYTPLTISLLVPPKQTILLATVWIGSMCGVAVNVFWLSPPRWLTASLCVILGWVAIWFLPDLWHSGGPAVVILTAAGGVLYTLGAVVYATKHPDPIPKWFGFHEVFHLLTVCAWITHCVAVFMAVLAH